MKRCLKNGARLFVWLTLTALFLTSCVGPDFTPDYFGIQQNSDETEDEAIPSESDVPGEEATEAPIDIFKLVVGEDGRQIDVSIPSKNTMEVSTGTYISRDETEIGPKYTTQAKFKILNTSSSSIDVSLPPQIGPFYISSLGKLEQNLGPKQFIIITISFTPSLKFVSEGEKIVKEIEIAGHEFKISGIALDPSGQASINVLNDQGDIERSDTAILTFTEIPLAAHPRRKYFMCDQVSCDGELRWANCGPCIDIVSGRCELLVVNQSGEPVNAVGSQCEAVTNDTTPAHEINLSSSDILTTKVVKKIVEVINTGTEPLIINKINIKEIGKTKSKAQFSINKEAIFIGESFEDVKENIFNAFESNEAVDAARLPIVLPPFDPPVLTSRAYMVLAYHPSDIIGSDGAPAAVGSSSKDEAILMMTFDDGKRELALAGTTTIKEIPALQIFVKTSTGIRPITNEEIFPIKGITTDTENLALPLFMKVSDSATVGLRISSINLTGNNFEWLNTKDKIDQKPEEDRCAIPVFDDSGSQTDIITELEPVSLNPNGFSLEPGSYTPENMPLFGCMNFYRDIDAPLEKATFRADMTITAQELTANGQVATNPDGSIKETPFHFGLLGVIDPLKGRVILRISQTMSGVMNPQFPGLSSVASDEEMQMMIAAGIAKESDRDIFRMAMQLDPFDEETIYDVTGEIASTPGDGITAVFNPVDTRAIPIDYEDPALPDYTSLIFDSTLPEGEQGVFEGYDNIPEGFKAGGLRIYTATLSYPGPLAKPEERPDSPSECEIVDPCTAEGQRRHGEGPANPAYKGVCAYFYTTAGSFDSPAFHYPNEEPPGTRRDMCKDREKPYELKSIQGKYTLDGRMEFPSVGMFFQGPTYFHNPSGPLGPVSPLNELFHLTFTTEALLPLSETKDIDRVPDKRIDTAKGEYKVNLNDPYSDLPQLCPNNTKNRFLQGNYYSTWKYIASLLKKDKEGKIPAGCPEEDNNFTGGIAYLNGKRLDHKTGHATFVAAGKFSSSDDLTFAFKDVMMFIILNGWFCDPLGPEEEMEGSHCYDKEFNYRDAMTEYSIVGNGP